MRKFILTLALVAGTAQAGSFWDGNKLLSKLQGPIGEQMQGLGYIMGVADAIDTITVCSPNNATAGQMLDIVKQYMDAYPALRHNTADLIVARALSRVWPCEKKGNAL